MSSAGETGQELAEELLLLETRVLDPHVRRSPEALGRLLAEEFTEFGSSGRIFTKSEVLIELSSQDPISISITEFELRFADRASAIVTYKTSSTDDSGAIGVCLRSSVWILRDARWQMLFHQGTRS